MFHGRRKFFGLLAMPSSDKEDGDSPSDKQVGRTPEKLKLARLTSLIFRRDKSTSAMSRRRAVKSMDIPTNNDTSECQLASLTSTGRQPESHVVAYLGTRLRGECSLRNFERREVDTGGPHFHAANTQHLASSCDKVPLCAATISAPSCLSGARPRTSIALAALSSETANNPAATQDSGFITDCTVTPSADLGFGTFSNRCSTAGTSTINNPQKSSSFNDNDNEAAGRPPTVTTPHSLRSAGAAVAAKTASRLGSPQVSEPAVEPTPLLTMCQGAPPAMQRACWSLSDYCIQRRLFKSPMSQVYAAVCLHSSIPVALKVYDLYKVPSNVLHMLGKEISIQSSLAHKNIVMLYGAFQDAATQRLVLVQQFAANGDLHELHRSLGSRMSEDQVRVLVLQPLLEAVVYFHASGIVHRDIKPDNILFTADWRLVLADFGVAINLATERAVTRTGTVGYMAPEVERCPIKSRAEENKDNLDLSYTTAADVWAIGCLTYLLLLGFPPFIAGTASSHGSASGNGNALSFPSSTSDAARDFICEALEESPADRPTAAQLLHHPWIASM